MSEEQKLLSCIEAKVGLYPKRSTGALILKGVAGFFLGVVPRLVTFKAIDNWSKSGFFKTMREGTQIEQGDIKDIVDKQIKLTELTLTNQNFFFLYEKGFVGKKQKLVVLPLEHAKRATAHKGKCYVVYEVPQEGKDKPQHFQLNLEVVNSDNWAKTINDVIVPPPP